MKMGILYSDGGARGNPGPAASGAVLFSVDESGSLGSEIDRTGKYLGETTNNIAEYRALIIGMILAESYEITHLTCFLDSELIVKQLNGEYKVKNENMKNLFTEVQELLDNFQQIEFKHIRREKNKIADSIVNEILDNQSS